MQGERERWSFCDFNLRKKMLREYGARELCTRDRFLAGAQGLNRPQARGLPRRIQP